MSAVPAENRKRLHFQCGQAFASRKQPVSQTAAIGQDVAFTVQANGKDLRYQWYFSEDQGKTWEIFQVANGSQNNTLQLVASRQNNGLLVRCEITNDQGATRLTNTAEIKIA